MQYKKQPNNAVAVITAPLVGIFIKRLGTKWTVCMGLAVAGTFTMLFGLSKDYFGVTNPNQQYLFIIFSFAYGLGSTLADTGMLVAVESMCTNENLARFCNMTSQASIHPLLFPSFAHATRPTE